MKSQQYGLTNLIMSYWIANFSRNTSLQASENNQRDHHAIVFRLPLFGNKMSESFLKNMNFDGQHWTKVTKRKRSAKEPTERNMKKQSTQTDDNEKLKCLLSPNWLTSDVIDMYIKLLQKLDQTVLIYDTAFFHNLMQCGCREDDMMFRYEKVTVFQKFYIPIYKKDHCFLVTFDKSVIHIIQWK
jgi:Ulp1 family protease